YASTSHLERITPSSRSSRSGDHRCSRRESPEYDRREGRVVSRLQIVMKGICWFEAPQSSLVSLQLDCFLKALSVFSRFKLEGK
ncbi:hypothetical protein Tco_0034482, partial [Tanacetum coccineum]